MLCCSKNSNYSHGFGQSKFEHNVLYVITHHLRKSLPQAGLYLCKQQSTEQHSTYDTGQERTLWNARETFQVLSRRTLGQSLKCSSIDTSKQAEENIFATFQGSFDYVSPTQAIACNRLFHYK